MGIAWYFEHESEKEYRQRARASFRLAIEAHIKTVKLQRSRFLKDHGSQAAHYRWTARHVCLGWTWNHIAKNNGVIVTWQAIRKAVLPILDRIGIPRPHNLQKTKNPSF